MSMIKEKFPISVFEEYMSGMRGYIKAHANCTDDSYISSKEMQDMYDKIVKFSYMSGDDIEQNNRDGLVRCIFTNFELENFYTCHGWSFCDDETVDWFDFYTRKYQEYLEEKKNKLITVKEAYEKYLQSDEFDSRGKKTKAHFYRISGYSQGQLTEALNLDAKQPDATQE